MANNILSGWLGDPSQLVGLFGLGYKAGALSSNWTASFEADGQAAAQFTLGHGVSGSFEADGQAVVFFLKPIIIISAWMGDPGEQCGILGLGYLASSRIPFVWTPGFEADGEATATFSATLSHAAAFESDVTFGTSVTGQRVARGAFEADVTFGAAFTGHKSTPTPVHWHGTFECDATFGSAFASHRSLHRGFQSDTTFGSTFASVRGLHRGFECDAKFDAAFSNRGKIFIPSFVSSFDNTSSPLGAWNVTASASLVGSRNGNGATNSNLLASVPGFFFQVSPGTTLSGAVLGFAADFSDFSSLGSTVAYIRSIDGSVEVRLRQLGDGRLYVQLVDTFGSQQVVIMPATSTTLGLPGFVAYSNDYNYFEFAVYLTIVDIPGGVGHPDSVSVTCVPYLRVNGELVWTGLLANGGNVPPSPMPNGQLYYVGLSYPDGVYDDVYANPFYNSPSTDFLGDVKADANDLTVEVLPAAPDITQALSEVGFHQTSPLILTQVVSEVAFNNTAPLLLTQAVMEVAFSRIKLPSYAHTRGAHARV